jgi:hypothetical protein
LIWASIVGAVFLVPTVTLLVVNQFFTDYRDRTTSWEPRGVSDDGRTFTIEYITCRGDLESFDRVERIETSSTVTLTVVLRESSRGDCEDIAIFHTAEVELTRSLGDRRLIDGRTGLRPDFGIVTHRSRLTVDASVRP